MPLLVFPSLLSVPPIYLPKFVPSLLCSYQYDTILSYPLCSVVSSPLPYSFSNLICSVWYVLLAPIRYVCSDPIHSYMLTLILLIWLNPIQSDLILSYPINYFWSTHYTLLWYSLPFSLQSNSILLIDLPSIDLYILILGTSNFA